MITQVLPHSVWPAGQPPRQVPPSQCCPAPQLLPQPPQLFTSVRAFTHAPSQQVWPLSQQFVPWLPLHSVLLQGQTRQSSAQQYWPLAQHLPAQQVWPAVQQLAPLVPVQAVCPLGQASTQTSWTQSCPGAQQPPGPRAQQAWPVGQQRPEGQQCWEAVAQTLTT